MKWPTYETGKNAKGYYVKCDDCIILGGLSLRVARLAKKALENEYKKGVRAGNADFAEGYLGAHNII